MRMTRRQRRLRRRDPRGRRGPIRRAARALLTAVYASVAALLLAAALAPFLAWAEWRIDLAAQFAAHAAAVTAVAAAWWAISRRPVFAGVALVALTLHAATLLPGRARWADPGDAHLGSPVRVLQFNALATNRDADAVIELFLTSDADIVSLLEPSYQVLDAGFRRAYLKGAYPYFDQHQRGAHLGWQYLLSKWPIREFVSPQSTVDPEGPASGSVIAVVVERPGGAFGAVLIHPQSPRNPGRWRNGNELVERAAVIVQQMRAAGLPVVLLADLNSTPSGYRSRLLARSAGLRRCKPLLLAEGTFPARWPWPRRIAIDDAWVSDEIRVTSWQTAGPAGSDHAAVIVDLLVPKSAPNSPTPDADPYVTFGLP